MAIKQAKIKVVWRKSAFRELRTLPGVMADINGRAARIAAAAGPGYEVNPARVTGGRGRARASVKTATTTARRREPREHNLLRALNAGRLTVRFPDAEALVIGYLNGRLTADGDTARASTRVPDTDRPGRLVRVILTGSTRLDVARRDAQVTVECWAPNGPDAVELGEKVYAWLSEMDTPDGYVPQGADGWVGGPYSQPDPETRSPRYVMTAIVRMRGQ